MQQRVVLSQRPDPQNRYAVFLRVVSVVVIVFGHWFLAFVWRRGGQIGVHNAVGANAWLWPLTWAVQAMPLFFFAGGVVHLEGHRSQRERRASYRVFLGLSYGRLFRPILIFILLWGVAELALHWLDAGGDGVIRGSLLPFGPLWLLLIYLAVMALTPIMYALHRRVTVWVPVALALLIAFVDLLRFWPNVPFIGWLNLLLAWVFAHQLGFFSDSLGPAAARRMAIGGLGALVILTNINVYPRSMIGTDVELVSNLYPPTLCLAALTVSLVGFVSMVRQRVVQWLDKDRVWTAVAAADNRIVTIYLWHLTAYLMAALVLYPLGLGRASGSAVSWWIQRPLWLGLPSLILALLVAFLGRFERRRAGASGDL